MSYSRRGLVRIERERIKGCIQLSVHAAEALIAKIEVPSLLNVNGMFGSGGARRHSARGGYFRSGRTSPQRGLIGFFRSPCFVSGLFFQFGHSEFPYFGDKQKAFRHGAYQPHS